MQKQVDRGAETVIQDLHDAGIGGGVMWMEARGGFAATLGDPPTIMATLPSMAAATDLLRAEGVERYPDSVFARKHRR